MLLLMSMLELTAEVSSPPFSDVSPQAYYYDAVAAAKALGITSGVGGNKFL